MKHVPVRDRSYLGGWKQAQTVLQVYQQPDETTLREAFTQRRPFQPARVAASAIDTTIDTTPLMAENDDARRAL
ncbi:MAG TPA: hypothetical protein VMH88_10710 [Gemmatimonadales bacterium]|nr:hypothetical protein [Gemmatimonadales bacterium]